MKKNFLYGLMVASLFGCNGNFSSDSTSNSPHNNPTTDSHSQTGISSCTQGSTFVCDQVGPGQFTQTETCTNVRGEPVILSGPEPIDESLADACPSPTSVPIAG